MSNYEWAVKVTFGNGSHVIDGARVSSRAQAENQRGAILWSFPIHDDPGPEDVAGMTLVRREVGPWEDQ